LTFGVEGLTFAVLKYRFLPSASIANSGEVLEN
jgi:hypothetical protein